MGISKLQLIVNQRMSEQFTLDEIGNLMYQTLLKKEDMGEELQINRIGVISGFIDLNGELEVTVKYISEMKQYSKSALSAETFLINDSIKG